MWLIRQRYPGLLVLELRLLASDVRRSAVEEGNRDADADRPSATLIELIGEADLRGRAVNGAVRPGHADRRQPARLRGLRSLHGRIDASLLGIEVGPVRECTVQQTVELEALRRPRGLRDHRGNDIVAAARIELQRLDQLDLREIDEPLR